MFAFIKSLYIRARNVVANLIANVGIFAITNVQAARKTTGVAYVTKMAVGIIGMCAYFTMNAFIGYFLGSVLGFILVSIFGKLLGSVLAIIAVIAIAVDLFAQVGRVMSGGEFEVSITVRNTAEA
jgi:hypothetical protein